MMTEIDLEKKNKDLTGIEKSVILKTGYKDLQRELSRIRVLIWSSDDQLPKELKAEKGILQKQFLKPYRIIQGQVNDIRDMEELDEAWNIYIKLRYKLLPELASELLAVIGGIYLRTANLENLYEPTEKEETIQGVPEDNGPTEFEAEEQPSQETYMSRISFTGQAEKLIDNLNERSQMGLKPLLIVGEERYDPSDTEILHLRFPACDIWHLPFTAHEYGYTVAYKSNDEDEKLGIFRMQLRRKYQKDENSIKKISHFDRLFADGFATYYVGPAYPFALLYLSFLPYDIFNGPSRLMPSFTERFVVAMEIMEWMNTAPKLTGYSTNLFDETLFSNEVDNTGKKLGLRALWYKTKMSLRDNNSDTYKIEYETTKNKIEEWIEFIKSALFNLEIEETPAIKDTYKYWKLAEELAKFLTGEEEMERGRRTYDLWPILNAAWYARHQKPEFVPQIESKAINLIAELDRDPETSQTISMTEIDLMMTAAYSAPQEVKRRLDGMIRGGQFWLDEEVIKYFKSHRDKRFERAYRKLCPPPEKTNERS